MSKVESEPNPIMIVAMGVAPEKEGEFNEFYHHRFLPAILASSEEVASIRRYEELNISGTLRWYTKQFLTIYELAGEDGLARADKIFARPGMKDLVTEFQTWKRNDLRNFSRISYRPRYEHQRRTLDGHFGSRPFILCTLEMTPEADSAFQEWYETTYLPLQVADIPEWCALRRYTSVDSEQVRHLTFFEAGDESSLMRSFDNLRARHRIAQNREWKRRVESGLVFHDATSFRCIYRRPG